MRLKKDSDWVVVMVVVVAAGGIGKLHQGYKETPLWLCRRTEAASCTRTRLNGRWNFKQPP